MPDDIPSMKHWKLSKMRTLEWSPAIFQAKPCAPTGRKKRRARSIEAPSIRDCLKALIGSCCCGSVGSDSVSRKTSNPPLQKILPPVARLPPVSRLALFAPLSSGRDIPLPKCRMIRHNSPMTPLLSDPLQASERIRRNNSVKYYGKIPSISR